MKNLVRGFSASLVMIIAMPVLAAPVDPAVRTIALDPGQGMGSASSVTYHPGFDRYYGSNTGSASFSAWAFGPSGGAFLQELNPLNVDAWAWNYNPNTGELEISSFSACCSGDGIVAAGVDGSGNLTGGTTVLLASPVTGIASSQSAPFYDPVGNVLYSRGSGSTVNIVNRTDGSLAGSVVLDFASAGPASVPDDGVVYIAEEGWLGVVDSSSDDFLAFDMAGNFVARIALDIDVTNASRRIGYANGQLFVFDGGRDLWQGFQVTDAAIQPSPGPGPAVPVPTLSFWTLMLLCGLFGLITVMQRQRLFKD